jgi:chromosomal replication initiator protein
MHEQWQACVDRMSGQLSAQAHRTYIRPLVYLGFDAASGVLRLGAPSQLKLNIVREQFARTIDAAVAGCFEQPVTVRFEVTSGSESGLVPEGTDPDRDGAADTGPQSVQDAAAGADDAGPDDGDGQAAPAAALAGIRDGGVGIASDQASAAAASGPARRKAAARRRDPAAPGADGPATGFGSLGARAPDDQTRLLPDVTFATFVTGKANELARAAAAKVAERPGSAYNPLFIYGGVGLGKTHLMHAVGNAILERQPTASVRYVSANQFFQDMVQALRRETVDQFKSMYQSLDLLLIDDIQFLSGKQRSQEEFFYVFESLVANHRQILISSDTYPKEMSGLDDRLKSRFNSGLIAAIEPPEEEMRVAILLRKAEMAHVRVPEEVAYFVAKHIRQNVRELEGALARIIHYAEFRQAPIEIELVKEALRDLLSYNRGQISIELIQRTVADYYGIKIGDMGSSRRPARLVLPRQIAMYLAKELTQKSLPEIGEAFGGRDHTTVLYAVRKIQQERRHQAELNHKIHVLEQTLREYL